jgi:phosphoribosyl 1,2-cyclic phosphate phosphodiesterase
MELVILGTAAADGWPAMYCDCAACAEARRRGGPNLRTRSGALVDDDLKIDHNTDTLVHMQRLGRSLARVKTILFTHQHPDHLYATDLKRNAPPNTSTRPQEPIAVYGNEYVLAEIRRCFADPGKLNLDLRPLLPLEPVVTPTGDTVLPLPARHERGSLLLRITRRGKTILYGHDSGSYLPETLDALGDGTPLDVALLDCTLGGQKDTPNRHHMNIDGMLLTVDELRRRGAIVNGTRVIATHFSHNGLLLHEELVQTLLPHGVEVAFDGMVVRV